MTGRARLPRRYAPRPLLQRAISGTFENATVTVDEFGRVVSVVEGAAPGSAEIPAGVIVMWSGLLSAIPSGWALCDGTGGTPDLRDRFVKGAAAGIDPGATAGAATHLHADHAAQAHSGGAVDAHKNGAVSAHAGTAVADHAAHTHTYTQVVNHVHVQTVNSATTGGLSGYAPDTSTNTPATSGYSTANPTGGVATGTTANPSATLTHSVTQPNAHTFTQPDDHAFTQPNAHPSMTHTAGSSEPAHYVLAFIMKT